MGYASGRVGVCRGGLPRIDWGHPLAKKLVCELPVIESGASTLRDIASGLKANANTWPSTQLSWTVTAKGRAIAHNGAAPQLDRFAIANDSRLQFTGPFSARIVFRCDAVPSANVWVFDKDYATGYALIISPSLVRFFTNGGGLDLSLAVAAGTVYDICLVWDGANRNIYVDGELLAQAAGAAPTANTAELSLLTQSGGGNNFTGSVSRLSLWGRALKSSEVTRLRTEPDAYYVQRVQRRRRSLTVPVAAASGFTRNIAAITSEDLVLIGE